MSHPATQELLCSRAWGLVWSPRHGYILIVAQFRFTSEQVEKWRDSGFLILNRFLEPQEYDAVLGDFHRLYGTSSDRGDARSSGEADDGRWNSDAQFANIHTLPYEGSVQLNLLSLHPQLIGLAQALLGTSQVYLYQSHTWAKFTGEADYEQCLHCDFFNHTLTVPSEATDQRTANFVLYFSEVTAEMGAMRYVTKDDVSEVLGERVVLWPTEEEQVLLRARERTAAVPAGSLLAHGIDTLHRGSNLTAPNGYRWSLTVGYKAAANDQLGFHVWQGMPHRPWHHVFEHATAEQLACLGVPRPGHPFWTKRTLELAQRRWQKWDMSDYHAGGKR